MDRELTLGDLANELQRVNQRLAKLERLALATRAERQARRRWDAYPNDDNYDRWEALQQAKRDLDAAFAALDSE